MIKFENCATSDLRPFKFFQSKPTLNNFSTVSTASLQLTVFTLRQPAMSSAKIFLKPSVPSPIEIGAAKRKMILLKIGMLGDPQVGKTTLMMKYVNGKVYNV